MVISRPNSGLRFIFDVGGVLIRHDDALLCEGIAALCDHPERARKAVIEMLQDPLVGTGRTGIDALHLGMVADWGFRGGYSQFLDLWSSHFSELPGMMPVLEHLARHHRVVLFSNTNEAHWSYLMRHYAVLRCAKSAYLSYQLGLMKPDAASFQYVLEREGCSAGQCFFVDDRVENVAAARGVGMIGHAFTGVNRFANALSDYGFEVRGWG